MDKRWRHVRGELPDVVQTSQPRQGKCLKFIPAVAKLAKSYHLIFDIIRGMKMIAVTCALICASGFGAVMPQLPEPTFECKV